MSSYLDIARRVLLEARRPLTAKSIMRLALQRELVPHHLYGKTQHKTLQARLSEDILHRGEHSAFFRNEPGKYFLREFLTDPSIPARFRQTVLARRRTRDLLRGPALALKTEGLSELASINNRSAADVLGRIRRNGWFCYVEPKAVPPGFVLLWSIAAVHRGGKILTYRTGRYRDGRDAFHQKRSICFASLVMEQDQSLFDHVGFGVIDAALTAASIDLNIPIDRHLDPDGMGETFSHSLRCLSWGRDESAEVIACVEVTAPDWFEPIQSRLSINDLRWMDIRSQNCIEDFDPWSRALLVECFNVWGDHGAEPRANLHF